MKRFLCYILLFLCGIVLLYPPVAWLTERSGVKANIKFIPDNYGRMGKRLAEADNILNCTTQMHPDILFVGSSHCYRTFDTRVYNSAGISAFNLGSSNQTPKQSLALLQRYLKQWHPQLLVIEVHPDIIGNNGNESACDIVSNTRIDMPILRMSLKQKDMRTLNTMCCSMFDRLVCPQNGNSDSIFIVPVVREDTTVDVDFAYVSGGYVEVTPLCWDPRKIDDKRIEIRNDQLRALQKCVKLACDNGIDCLFVEVPSSKSLYKAYTNHKEFENAIRTAVGDNCRYINLNDSTDLQAMLNDSTCFFDEDHLNQKGTNILNKYLLFNVLR